MSKKYKSAERIAKQIIEEVEAESGAMPFEAKMSFIEDVINATKHAKRNSVVYVKISNVVGNECLTKAYAIA